MHQEEKGPGSWGWVGKTANPLILSRSGGASTTCSIDEFPSSLVLCRFDKKERRKKKRGKKGEGEEGRGKNRDKALYRDEQKPGVQVRRYLGEGAAWV